jgi:hypothetical protein
MAYLRSDGWDQFEFRIVRRPKLVGPGTHDGLQLPDGSVVHLTNTGGADHCYYRQFEQGRQVETVRVVRADYVGYVQIMDRVHDALAEQKPYHAVDWNCERFVRSLLGEPPDSPQVTGWFVLAVGAAAIAIAARS